MLGRGRAHQKKQFVVLGCCHVQSTQCVAAHRRALALWQPEQYRIHRRAAQQLLGGPQALSDGLRLDAQQALVWQALRRQGDITRAVQVQMIASTVWESVKHGAAVSMILAVVLLVCPWLSLPLSVLGLVGMGKASLDLFHAFWDALDELQRAELLAAAMEAGVNLRTYLRGGDGAWA